MLSIVVYKILDFKLNGPLGFDSPENVTKQCVHGANHQKWETNQIGPPLQTHICCEMASPKSLKIHSTIPSESGA
jgi:hypothetical protein